MSDIKRNYDIFISYKIDRKSGNKEKGYNMDNIIGKINDSV